MDEKFKEDASKLVTIEDIPALSKLKLTFTGQQRGQTSASFYNKVAGSLKNLRERKLKGVDVKNILITCKKDAWLNPTNDNQIKLGPFAKKLPSG